MQNLLSVSAASSNPGVSLVAEQLQSACKGSLAVLQQYGIKAAQYGMQKITGKIAAPNKVAFSLGCRSTPDGYHKAPCIVFVEQYGDSSSTV